eukprot:6241343-Prymnesium_polylepis.1
MHHEVQVLGCTYGLWRPIHGAYNFRSPAGPRPHTAHPHDGSLPACGMSHSSQDWLWSPRTVEPPQGRSTSVGALSGVVTASGHPALSRPRAWP